MALKPSVTKLTILATLLCGAFAEGTVYLEKHQPGVVPCSHIATHQYKAEDIEAFYWYHGETDSDNLLISSFNGQVAPQNGIPVGVYDVSTNFSLIINNVSESQTGGCFSYKIKPRSRRAEIGKVIVNEKVRPRALLPSVSICRSGQRLTDGLAECKPPLASTTNDASSIALICAMSDAKPPVVMRWLRENGEAFTTQTVNTSLDVEKDTYTTSASVELAVVDDEAVYTCEVSGIALPHTVQRMVGFTHIQLVDAQTSAYTYPPNNTDITTTGEQPVKAKDACTCGNYCEVAVPVLATLMAGFFIVSIVAILIKLLENREVFQIRRDYV